MGTITMTAKELKNRTGDAFRAVSRGERVLLTRRGKAVAVLVPVDYPSQDDDILPYDQAWQEIEAALAASPPEFASLEEAMSRSRRRA
jgi:prevent-host-death family protein